MKILDILLRDAVIVDLKATTKRARPDSPRRKPALPIRSSPTHGPCR